MEYVLSVKSAGNLLLYTEMATSLIRRLRNDGADEDVNMQDTVVPKETNISKMFQTVQLEITDSRYALSVCGKCKSTNVRNEAMQVRSADEGMSVFSTCLECGHKWVQR